MSAGKKGRPASNTAPPCMASRTLDSKPYMCCDGTVATRVVPASVAWPKPWPSRVDSECALRTSRCHGLACGTGSPVEPDVKTWAATRPARDLRAGGDAVGCGMADPVGDRRQAVAGRVVVGLDQGIGLRKACPQALDRVRRVVRRQQVDVAAQERRTEADGEPVAVGRQVEHGAGGGQPLGQGGRVGDELAARDRHAVADRQRGVERTGDQPCVGGRRRAVGHGETSRRA